jgi:hypothetical protein
MCATGCERVVRRGVSYGMARCGRVTVIISYKLTHTHSHIVSFATGCDTSILVSQPAKDINSIAPYTYVTPLSAL